MNVYNNTSYSIKNICIYVILVVLYYFYVVHICHKLVKIFSTGPYADDTTSFEKFHEDMKSKRGVNVRMRDVLNNPLTLSVFVTEFVNRI